MDAIHVDVDSKETLTSKTHLENGIQRKRDLALALALKTAIEQPLMVDGVMARVRWERCSTVAANLLKRRKSAAMYTCMYN
jgi:DUF1365 family protein